MQPRYINQPGQSCAKLASNLVRGRHPTHFHRRFPCFLLLTALGSATHNAQSQGPALTFAAVTIKPSVPNNPNSNLNFDQGRLTTENTALLSLLQVAYGLSTASDAQIANAPAWLRTRHFDIQAKEDDDTVAATAHLTPAENEKAQDAMLRALFAERLQLRSHFETQPRNVAVLTLAKGPLKLQRSTGCSEVADLTCKPNGWQGLHNDGQGHLEGRHEPLAMLANVLAAQPDIGGRLVVDQTALTGDFDFDLHYTPDNKGNAEANGPSLFTALREQLGLQLNSAKLPVRVLVIDHIEQPSPN